MKRKVLTLKFNSKMLADYSTKKVSRQLLLEIKGALKKVGGFGSVEIYVQDNTVTQITVRNIRKTNGVSNVSKQ